MMCSLSTNLGDNALAEITRLEEDLGQSLLAFSCHDFNPAELTQEQLSRVKVLEDRLGVSLVAVRS